MQESINDKTIALSTKTAKLTAQELKKLMLAYLKLQNKQGKKLFSKVKSLTGSSKTTVEKLNRKYDGLKSIEIAEGNIKDFERVAKKYGIEFALKKDDKTTPPTYLVFFKGKDLDVFDMAFREYLGKQLDKEKRPSLRESLKKFAEKVKSMNKDKTKNKSQEQSL